MKRIRLAVLLVAMVAIAFAVLAAPIVPVQNTITKTKTRPVWYSAQIFNQSGIPIFVNVTNTDSVGGVFSVELRLSSSKPVVGGVEFEGRETETQALFIDAGATGKFSSPEEWAALFSVYTFFYYVTPPLMEEKYNVTTTEYKSVFSIIYSP